MLMRSGLICASTLNVKNEKKKKQVMASHCANDLQAQIILFIFFYNFLIKVFRIFAAKRGFDLRKQNHIFRQ